MKNQINMKGCDFQCLPRIKVGERGQIVIPKYARKVFEINAGDRLMVMGDVSKGGLALAKVSFGDFFKEV